MHLFFSVGEPSGDQHAAQVISEIRRRHPQVRVSGFGGPAMQQAGCEQLYPLTNLAVMGVADVLPLLWTFIRLIARAGRYFQEERPDAVVLVDFPGFNWWIARKAKRLGIPVFYYLPPQLWAWAPWRIRKVRRFVDHVLSALRFEVEWYRQRGVHAEYVGHPFFDEVARHPVDRAAIVQLTRGGRRVVGLLPGSRRKEVTRNFPTMLQIVRRLQADHPDVRFAVACYKPLHFDLCRKLMAPEDRSLPIELLTGRTSEIIAAADCCLMVSGSVSLELLARETPAAVMYRGTWMMYVLAKLLVRCRYITLVNLLASRELMPEFPFVSPRSKSIDRIHQVLDGWLTHETTRQDAVHALRELKGDVARTGGISAAANAILQRMPTIAHQRAA